MLNRFFSGVKDGQKYLFFKQLGKKVINEKLTKKRSGKWGCFPLKIR
jgi:hypothetical protein